MNVGKWCVVFVVLLTLSVILAAPAMAQNASPGGGLTEESFGQKIQAFWDELQKGGITMIFLGLLSLIGLTFIIERFVCLRSGSIAPGGMAIRANQLYQKGQMGELSNLLKSDRSTLSRIIGFVLDNRQAPLADVSMAAGDIGAREIRRHYQRIMPLAIVATVSPLLGLLGTVVGMIEAFDVVAMAGTMNDAGLLADSIAKALVTTAAGLVVSIPSLIAYHYFKSRTNGLAIRLEEEASMLINRWMLPQEARQEA
ncbi:MAG: MotA/TolQ/ExbB proton channel family protein [Phycisphaerae bacterium]